MSVLAQIANYLRDPRLEGVDIDTPDLMRTHKEILTQKPMMRGVFAEFYAHCVAQADKYFTRQGSEIEIGAGVSFFKQAYPQIISTDIKPSPDLDTVLDAQAMNVPSQSVRALYGINCFHHLPEPRKFFAELERVCKPGGGAVLIEPYHSLFGRILYKSMHRHEHFNTRQKTWETPLEPGQFMSGANQALAYVILVKDRARFEREFPGLEIVSVHPLDNWLRYLLSGGLNFRQLLPDNSIPFLKTFEKVLRPFEKLFALHYVIVLRRRETPKSD